MRIYDIKVRISIERAGRKALRANYPWNHWPQHWRIVKSGAAITREIFISLREESVPYTAQRVAANRFL